MTLSVIIVLKNWHFVQSVLKDVELPKTIPHLLLDKHTDYLVSYGTNKDDYVCIKQ